MAQAASIIDEIAGPEEALPGEEDVTQQDDAAGENAGEKPGEKPAAEGGEGEKDESRQDRHVPLAALHEERARRQEMQARLDETLQKVGRMEALWERAQKEKEAPKEEGPNFDDDPAGALRAQMAAIQGKLDAIEGERGQQKQQEQARSVERQMLERYASSVRDYSRTTPDFNAAYDFVAKAVDAELIARGYEDPVERTNIMQYEEGLMVGRAMKAGKNPAELVYNYAKARGYKPNGAANGEDNKLDRLEKGQKAAMSLSNAGGKGEGSVTLERLSELEGDEFDKAWAAAKQKGLLG